jgi:hypothetical protein
MAYVRKKFIGGSLTVALDKLGGSPLFDSYTFQKEENGIVYCWTGVRASSISKEGEAVFHLPEMVMHSSGGPYLMQLGPPLA